MGAAVLTGDAVTVRHGTHDGADGQAVEIVVDKDHNAEDKGRKLSAHAGLDVLLRPATECCAAAGNVDEGDDDAQQHQEQEDTGVAFDTGDKTVVNDGVERADGGKAVDEQSADRNADKERGVDLLGDQRQTNGDDRRNK